MNACYRQDLEDYYNYPWDRTNQEQWLQEELRLAAKDRFDHLIVEGCLSMRAKKRFQYERLTLEDDAERKEIVFSGWTRSKTRGKRIASPFSKETVEKDDKLYAEQLAKQEAEERAYAEEMEKQQAAEK